MRTLSAIVLGKSIGAVLRKFNLGGGSAAPGLIALRIDPELVEGLSKKIPRNVVITGTNGKTTTSRLLAHFAKQEGLKVIRNHTGSNLERGIASTLIQNYGKKFNLGIWELDEAAFNTVVPKIKPQVVVFLNVFRDQLDRYGEVDIVVKRWSETLKKLPKSTIVLINGDDANTLRLSKIFHGKTYKFGVKDFKIVGESLKHIKENEDLDFEAKEVKLRGLSETSFQTILHGKPYATVLPIPGVYHIYDFLAAFACGINLGFDSKKMLSSLKNYSPAFGRVEKLDFGYIFLIKNPAGATQVFETIAPQIKPQDRLLLALNDNLADGTDVSWIWDGDFERLTINDKRLTIICSGTRVYDLANRLKYAGFDPKSMVVENDLKKALQEARNGLKGHLFILPTYTAMLELQSILTKQGLKKNYWEEDI